MKKFQKMTNSHKNPNHEISESKKYQASHLLAMRPEFMSSSPAENVHQKLSWHPMNHLVTAMSFLRPHTRLLVVTMLLLLGGGLAPLRGADAPPQTKDSATKGGTLPADRMITGSSEKARLPYLVTLPKGYDRTQAAKTWPLIVFLHGGAQVGIDAAKMIQMKGGIPEVAGQLEDFPFITLSPVIPSDSFNLYTEPLSVLIREILETYHGDADRVYLTGASLGGYGSWDMLFAHPEQFAAVVVVCGAAPGTTVRTDFAGATQIPVRAYHGDSDPVVPLSAAKTTVAAFQKAGGQVSLSILPGVGNESHIPTYPKLELYQWMLQQVRPHDASIKPKGLATPKIERLNATPAVMTQITDDRDRYHACQTGYEALRTALNDRHSAQPPRFFAVVPPGKTPVGVEVYGTIEGAFADQGTLKPATLSGGLYAVLPVVAAGDYIFFSNPSQWNDVARAITEIRKWLMLSDYKFTQGRSLVELIPTEGSAFRMQVYLPVEPR